MATFEELLRQAQERDAQNKAVRDSLTVTPKPVQSPVTAARAKISAPSVSTAVRARTGTIARKPTNFLAEAFDQNENYIEKAKKGNLGGAALNFAGTGLTAAQTFGTNILNNIQSLQQGEGIQPFKPMMDANDLENEVYKRSGDKPISQVISEKSPFLGSAYSLGLNIATDPLELTPLGFANDIKLAKGLNQGSQAYTSALQSGKLNPIGTTATLPRETTPAPQPRKFGRGIPQTSQPIPQVPTRSITAKPLVKSVGETTAQADGVFVDYYPERRAADVVKSNDFHSAAIEEGLDPEEFITIYRGAPNSQGKINNGDWVTTSEQLAKDYAGSGKIISDKVQAKYLYAPKGEGVDELIYSTNKAANVGEGKPKRFGRGVQPPTQAQNTPIQPRNQNLGSEIPPQTASAERIFYTGSPNPNIEKFIPGGDGKTKVSGDSFGRGVYLTDNPEVAKVYAQGDNGRVYKVSANNKLMDLDEKANQNFVSSVAEFVNNSDKEFKNRMLRGFGRKQVKFADNKKGLEFFENQENIWEKYDGQYEGNKPSVEKEGNEFIITYTDFDSDIKSSLSNATNKQIFESLSAVNSDEASELVIRSGYDGIEFRDSGAFQNGIEGKTAVIYTNSDRIKIQPETSAQQAGKFPSGKVEQKFKDLGADTNRFEEVAQIMTDSKQANPSIKEMAGDLIGNVKRKFIDSGDTVAKIAKENNDPGLYNLYNNAKQSRRRAEYHIGEAQTDLMGNKVGKSLKDIFDPIRAKGDNYYEDFQEYMYHLHNIDRMGFEDKAKQRLREFEIQHQDLADLTDKELKEILKTTDSDSGAVVKEYMKLIDDANNAPNKPVFGNSITAEESKKVSAYLANRYPEFANEAADVRKYLDNQMKYRVDSGLISQKDADDLAEIYKSYVPTYRANPSTKGLKTFGGAANISTGIKKATGSSKDLLPLHEQIAKQTMQTVEAAHKNLFGARLAENINPNTGKYVQELKKVDDKVDIDALDTPELKNTFNVYENGQAYQMKVDDGLYEGIKALAGTDPNELVKAATAVNRGFKELITSWNPMFLIRNVARDIQDVGLYSKDLKGFAKMYPSAIKEISTGGDIWKQYKALGGAGNSFFDYAKGYKKDPTWLRKNTLDRVEQLNMATEQLPRFAEFMASIEKLGRQPSYDELMQAMYNAADVTVNFGRSGTWGKTLNSTFVPFFNPAMQGASKLVRRFTETKGVKDWTSLVLKVSALGVAPSLINEMVYNDDPQYKMMNDREKDINYLFKIGDGEWVKIPKGRVLSLFGSTAQRTFRGIKGEEDAFAGLIKTMGDQVAPISPTESNIYSPIAAVRNNKSWFGGRIEPQRLEKYSPGKRFDESTTELSKAVGGALNISPKKIDYLLDAYSGVIGDFAMPLMTPKAERNPFAKAFVLDSVQSNKLSQQFYDKKDEIYQAKNDRVGEDKNDVLTRYMNKQADIVSKVNDEIRKAEGSGISNKLKREKVRDLKGSVNGIMQTSIETLPEIEKAIKQLSPKYKDTDDLYREVNKKVFGAEYALKTYNKDTYAKAKKYKGAGLSYDDFYKVYFATKDIESDKLNGKTVENSSSKKKKAAIDAAFPNATREQLALMYEMADISKTVGHYRRQFE